MVRTSNVVFSYLQETRRGRPSKRRWPIIIGAHRKATAGLAIFGRVVPALCHASLAIPWLVSSGTESSNSNIPLWPSLSWPCLLLHLDILQGGLFIFIKVCSLKTETI